MTMVCMQVGQAGGQAADAGIHPEAPWPQQRQVLQVSALRNANAL